MSALDDQLQRDTEWPVPDARRREHLLEVHVRHVICVGNVLVPRVEAGGRPKAVPKVQGSLGG